MILSQNFKKYNIKIYLQQKKFKVNGIEKCRGTYLYKIAMKMFHE